MELFWIIAAPLVAALLAPGLVRLTGGRGVGLLLSLVPFSISAWLLAYSPGGRADALTWSVPWMPSLGVDVALKVGGFESLFLLLVSFIGGLILIYGGAYLKGDRQLGRFYLVILLFMASMLGVIAADDMILTFVFWELTSVTSFVLVGFKHYDEKARKAALQALLVTGGGGLAMLAGFLVLTEITGSTRISELPAQAAMIGESPLFPLALVLILLGAFTKSAQFPFHFWLPGAMAAPTPVSAYLHSATMVKAGVILLAKLSPAMAHTDLWAWIVTPVGATTMVLGAVMSVGQTDLKRLLAYSTVSVLGALVMLLGFGDAFALKTGLFLALVHGLYKGSLFMIAGTVDHATGTRDVRSLSGLGPAMPVLAAAGCLAALSMSGAPPTVGFISKELLYEARSTLPVLGTLLVITSFIANSLGVAVALIVGVRPFFKQQTGAVGVGHAPGMGMVIPPLVLASLGLLLGFTPAYIDTGLISPGVVGLGADPSLAKVTLWHGFTWILALSALTLVAGAVVFMQRRRVRAIAAALGARAWPTPTGLYHGTLDGTLRLAAITTLWIQNGQLRSYVRVTVGAATLLIGYALVVSRGEFANGEVLPTGYFATVVVILMSVSAVAAVRARSRLSAILCLGGVGYSVALLFVAFGAPDLAITQLLVETLTVVLFSFVILKLPQIRNISRKRDSRVDIVIASVAGLSMTLLAYQAVRVQAHESISPGIVALSATEAFGRNVVNVILVDFRALDTMGEILVLALAGLGVTALLARSRKNPAGIEEKRRRRLEREQGRTSSP
jgi:multicomponent Na+:H+ antiporter subunit A